MSGFLLADCSLDRERFINVSRKLSFSENTWFEDHVLDEYVCTYCRVDDYKLWSSSQDSNSNISVILVAGRVSLEKHEWDKSEKLPYQGGLVCRFILDGYINDGESFLDSLNGSYCLIIYDRRNKKLVLRTDKFGFYPIYKNNLKESFYGSHPDILNEMSGNTGSYDLVTMSEMLSHWNSSHPYTYYKNIQQVDAGCQITLQKQRQIKCRNYWKPNYNVDNKLSLHEHVEELSNTIQKAVRLRTNKILGNAGVFLSGGADSRAILYSSVKPDQVSSITFYDEENEELRIARKLADRVGSTHYPLKRSPEFYGDGAARAVRITGGMWNLCDCHYTGFIEKLTEMNFGVLLSGCFADYFFKGIALDRQYKKLFGKNLPIFSRSNFNHQWYFQHSKINEKWLNAVETRCQDMYSGCTFVPYDDEQRWKVELCRIYPISREATMGTRLLLSRTLPWDPVLADNGLLSAYERIPVKFRLNGDAWRMAVSKICSKANDIVDNNYGGSVGSSQFMRIYHFLLGVLYRKIHKYDKGGKTLNGLATTGSWPNFYFYAKNSKVIEELWMNNTREQKEIFENLLGYNPWGYNKDIIIDKDISLFYRILTLKIWLDNN